MEKEIVLVATLLVPYNAENISRVIGNSTVLLHCYKSLTLWKWNVERYERTLRQKIRATVISSTLSTNISKSSLIELIYRGISILKQRFDTFLSNAAAFPCNWNNGIGRANQNDQSK